MLRKIKLMHFKCFEQLDLGCKPLNLLCGLNGTGKSSVIQAFLVLPLGRFWPNSSPLRSKFARNRNRLHWATLMNAVRQDEKMRDTPDRRLQLGAAADGVELRGFDLAVRLSLLIEPSIFSIASLLESSSSLGMKFKKERGYNAIAILSNRYCKKSNY